MTGTPNVEKIAAAVQADVNRVIAKPFDQEELLEAVAQLVDDEASHAPCGPTSVSSYLTTLCTPWYPVQSHWV